MPRLILAVDVEYNVDPARVDPHEVAEDISATYLADPNHEYAIVVMSAEWEA